MVAVASTVKSNLIKTMRETMRERERERMGETERQRERDESGSIKKMPSSNAILKCLARNAILPAVFVMK